MNQCFPQRYKHLYKVMPGDSISKVLYRLYGKENYKKMLEVVVYNNPQIARNPDYIRIGQILDVSPYKHPAMNRIGFGEYLNVERAFGQLGDKGEKILTQAPDIGNQVEVVDGVLKFSKSFSQNAVSSTFKHVNDQLMNVKRLMEQATSFDGGASRLRQNVKQFFKQPEVRSKFQDMPRALRAKIINDRDLLFSGQKLTQKLVKVPNNVRPSQVPQYLARTSKISKYAKVGKYGFGLALSVGLGAWEIIEAPIERKTKVLFREVGGISVGAAIGSSASTVVCVWVLGITTGPGALTCPIIVGGLGSYLGSEFARGVIDDEYTRFH
jgi:hypothetical protein